LLSAAWVCFVGHQVLHGHSRETRSDYIFDIIIFGLVSFGILLSFIRRERIEIYPDQMIWSKTYFAVNRSKAAPLSDILAVEWSEGDQRGEGKGPDYVEFYLSTGSVKACFGFGFDDLERMREDIRSMYPDLVKRWGTSSVHSKDFTLLTLS
jgi:hypothetical protein